MPSPFEAKPSVEELQAVAKRIEGQAGGPVAWALEFAQRDLGAMTAGDWYNVRLELAAWLLPFSERPESESLPSEDETRRLQRRFATILAGLLRDGQVHIGRYDISLSVTPRGGTGMTLKSPSMEGPYVTRLMLVLFDSRGPRRIKACVAPAPRGQEGKTCGRWFLASRVGQAYCSRRCQSRASTQAFRREHQRTRRRKKTKDAARRRRSKGA